MDWWLVITLIIAAAMAYGYWTHNHERLHLARLFGLLAPEHRGDVKPGSWLVFPQLRFWIGNRHYLITAMATDGTETGKSGPFTFVELEVPFDTFLKIRFKRNSHDTKRRRDGVATGRQATAANKEIDKAFQIEAIDPAFASSLLEAGVRQKLLGSRLPGLDVRVKDQKISVHMDGIAKSTADLEELIDIASLLAEHWPANATRGPG